MYDFLNLMALDAMTMFITLGSFIMMLPFLALPVMEVLAAARPVQQVENHSLSTWEDVLSSLFDEEHNRAPARVFSPAVEAFWPATDAKPTRWVAFHVEKVNLGLTPAQLLHLAVSDGEMYYEAEPMGLEEIISFMDDLEKRLRRDIEDVNEIRARYA